MAPRSCERDTAVIRIGVVQRAAASWDAPLLVLSGLRPTGRHRRPTSWSKSRRLAGSPAALRLPARRRHRERRPQPGQRGQGADDGEAAAARNKRPDRPPPAGCAAARRRHVGPGSDGAGRGAVGGPASSGRRGDRARRAGRGQHRGCWPRLGQPGRLRLGVGQALAGAAEQGGPGDRARPPGR